MSIFLQSGNLADFEHRLAVAELLADVFSAPEPELAQVRDSAERVTTVYNYILYMV